MGSIAARNSLSQQISTIQKTQFYRHIVNLEWQHYKIPQQLKTCNEKSDKMSVLKLLREFLNSPRSFHPDCDFDYIINHWICFLLVVFTLMVSTSGPTILFAKSMFLVVTGLFVIIFILIISFISAIEDVLVHDRDYVPSLHIQTVAHFRFFCLPVNTTIATSHCRFEFLQYCSSTTRYYLF